LSIRAIRVVTGDDGSSLRDKSMSPDLARKLLGAILKSENFKNKI
jgi:hypothetical protein